MCVRACVCMWLVREYERERERERECARACDVCVCVWGGGGGGRVGGWVGVCVYMQNPMPVYAPSPSSQNFEGCDALV